jgi:acyl-CoA thioesterase I
VRRRAALALANQAVALQDITHKTRRKTLRIHLFSRSVLNPSRLLVAALGILLGAAAAPCQLVQDYSPPKANCCLQFFAQRLADQMQDWNQLGRYHADDQKLMAEPSDPHRVVFLGDSITDGWHLDQYFTGKPYINRGISGQTTPQMLVRMFPDVIDLKPAAMIVLAGTNDIARNTGPETATMIEENFEAMTELAQQHGIKVILCLLTPVSDYTANKQTQSRPPADIVALNAWLRAYADRANTGLADYYSALVDAKGMLREGYSDDGLHPNAKGYELLAPVAEAAIEKALQ